MKNWNLLKRFRDISPKRTKKGCSQHTGNLKGWNLNWSLSVRHTKTHYILKQILQNSLKFFLRILTTGNLYEKNFDSIFQLKLVIAFDHTHFKKRIVLVWVIDNKIQIFDIKMIFIYVTFDQKYTILINFSKQQIL